VNLGAAFGYCLICLILLGSWAFGTTAEAVRLPDPGIADITGLQTIVCRVAGWLFTFLVVVAIIFIVIAAYNYLFAAEVIQGKQKLRTLWLHMQLLLLQ